MALELYGYANLTVKRVSRTPNQARILEAEHSVKVTSGDVLAKGTLVKFTDPELGLQFIGRIYSIQKRHQDGDGVIYLCADKVRMLTKTDARALCAYTTPAYTPGTSKIRMREGDSINAGIEFIMLRVMDSFPGGILNELEWPDPGAPVAGTGTVAVTGAVVTGTGTNFAFEVNVGDTISIGSEGRIVLAVSGGTLELDRSFATDHPAGTSYSIIVTSGVGRLYAAIDMGGEKIATWLNDILDQTQSGVFEVDYDEDGNERLHIYDYESQNTVELTTGNFTVLNRQTTAPLLSTGNLTDTSNNKWRAVNIEACGAFTRKVLEHIGATFEGTQSLPGDVLRYKFRFYPDESNILSNYLGPKEELESATRAWLKITKHPGGSPDSVDLGMISVPFVTKDTDVEFPPGSGTPNPNFGRPYFAIDVDTTPDDTGITFDKSDFVYTSYDGPLIVTQESDDDSLTDEGDFTIQMPRWFKFASPGLQIVSHIDGSISWELGSYVVPSGDHGTMLENIEAIDPTMKMTAFAAVYFNRFSNQGDRAGTFSVLIKSAMSEIRIGTILSNFNDMKVRQFYLDVPGRQIVAQVSDAPIRVQSARARDFDALWRQLYGNWRKKARIEEVPFMPDVTLDMACQIVDPYTATDPRPLPPHTR